MKKGYKYKGHDEELHVGISVKSTALYTKRLSQCH